MPKLDVVLRMRFRLQADGLANHKGHGFGFGFADLFGGEGAAVAAMQHLVADLMDERGKFLGGLHPGSSVIFPPWERPLAGPIRSE